jgi:hypothetical protein
VLLLYSCAHKTIIEKTLKIELSPIPQAYTLKQLFNSTNLRNKSYDLEVKMKWNNNVFLKLCYCILQHITIKNILTLWMYWGIFALLKCIPTYFWRFIKYDSRFTSTLVIRA